MFVDCNGTHIPKEETADVCVIGSGPAGLALARTLIESNKTVIVIERGGRYAVKPPSRRITFKNLIYDGIQNGIAFGYGGTGVLWGGQLLPMLDTELQQLGNPWSSKEFINELRENSRIIEKWFGVSSTSYYDSLLGLIKHPALKLKWNNFTPIFSKWITFRKRNIGKFWLRLFQSSKKIKVLLNLQPAEWFFSDSDNSSIDYMICQNDKGQFVKVKAEYYVIAAGALESPLILQKLMNNDFVNKFDVGNYLTDHFSFRIAEITDLNIKQFEDIFTPFFTGPTMRSFRFCLPNNGNTEWAYCHFVIEAPENSGFIVVRNILRGLQTRNLCDLKAGILSLPHGFIDIIRLIWLVKVNKRLAISKGSRIFVNMDYTKLPEKENSIFYNKDIDYDEIIINWSIDGDIKNRISNSYDFFKYFWDDNNLNSIGTLSRLTYPYGFEKAIDNIYDIYHPAGTCAVNRVVDTDLKIYGITNAYVVGSAVFPQLGRSNPTLTIMALSRRLGIRLSILMNGKSSPN